MADNDEDQTLEAGGRFVIHLAGRPILVVTITATVALAATGALSWLDPGIGAVGAISVFATLWALFLALIIYLLSARDTDRLMDRIAQLQDQLSSALAAPSSDAEVLAGPAAPPSPLAEAPPAAPAPAPAPATPPAAMPGAMPAEYLDAWQRVSGMAPNQIERAWNANRFGEGPWVVEGPGGYRWSLMRTRDGNVSTIPLGPSRQRGHARTAEQINEARQARQERQRAMSQRRGDKAKRPERDKPRPKR